MHALNAGLFRELAARRVREIFVLLHEAAGERVLALKWRYSAFDEQNGELARRAQREDDDVCREMRSLSPLHAPRRDLLARHPVIGPHGRHPIAMG